MCWHVTPHCIPVGAYFLSNSLRSTDRKYTPSIMVTLSPYGPIAIKLKPAWEDSCLSITRAAGLLDKVYNSLKSKPQNFLINCVGVSVYCNLKLMVPLVINILSVHYL